MAYNSSASMEDDNKKLFVGGLSSDTTRDDLQEYFGQYGDVENVTLKTDQNTGASKGFAFILFTTADAIDAVINAGDHTVNNKKVDASRKRIRQGKVFVGGITSEMSDDDIKDYFSQFGKIADVNFPMDKFKNERKAFCFITYESSAAMQSALKSRNHTINGKEVGVSRANEKSDQDRGSFRDRGEGRSRDGYGSQSRDREGYGRSGGSQGRSYNQDYQGRSSNGGGYGSSEGGGFRSSRGGYGAPNRSAFGSNRREFDNSDGGYSNGNSSGGYQDGGRGPNRRHQPY